MRKTAVLCYSLTGILFLSACSGTEAAFRYFLPLIQGEVHIEMRNGMPLHFKLK